MYIAAEFIRSKTADYRSTWQNIESTLRCWQLIAYLWTIAIMKDSSLITPVPLAELASNLQSGDLNLLDYIERVCDRLDILDTQIQAFLPEPDRRVRLRQNAEALMQ